MMVFWTHGREEILQILLDSYLRCLRLSVFVETVRATYPDIRSAF